MQQPHGVGGFMTFRRSDPVSRAADSLKARSTLTQSEALVLTFNDLLILQGVDPTPVRLVRHQDRRVRAGRLYEAWRNDRAAFEAYQSAQVREVFPVDAVLAS